MIETNNSIVEEKLKFIEKKHKERMNIIKKNYELKIHAIVENVGQCIFDVFDTFSIKKDDEKLKTKGIKGKADKGIKLIKKKIKSFENMTGKKEYLDEYELLDFETIDSFIEDVLKYRNNLGHINVDDVIDKGMIAFNYKGEWHAPEEYLRKTLGIKYTGYNYTNYSELFATLLDGWVKKHSFFDLFFNDTVNEEPKPTINAILNFYSYFRKFQRSHTDEELQEIFGDSLKWIKELCEQITVLLEKMLSENNSDVEGIHRIVNAYKSYSEAEETLEKYYKDLYDEIDKKGDKIQAKYRDYKRKRRKEYMENVYEKSKGHIAEIFGEIANQLRTGVSDTGFLYENHGGNAYGNIEEDESYKNIYNEGVNLLEHNRGNIQSLLPKNTTLVDVGCCAGDKAEALLYGIGKKITYLPVDVDKKYIGTSIGKIKDLVNDKITVEDGIESHGKITDPIETINSDGSRNYTYFFTGGSIGNYSDSDINQLLGTTFKPKQGNLVLDYYKAPKTIGEIKDILKSYDNDTTEDWFKSGLNNLGFTPWYYQTEFKKWREQLNIDDFLKFSVRYEFQDENGNKYYVELLDRKGDNVAIYRDNGGEWEMVDNPPKLSSYPGKIVEGFKALKNANETLLVPHRDVKLATETKSEDLFTNKSFQEYLNDTEVVSNTYMVGFKGKNDKFIPANFKEGEFYPIEISRRFSDEEMEAILKKNGRTIVKKFDKIGDNEDSKYLNVIVATISK